MFLIFQPKRGRCAHFDQHVSQFELFFGGDCLDPFRLWDALLITN